MKNIDFKSVLIGILITIIIFISISANKKENNLGDITVNSITVVDDNNLKIGYLGMINDESTLTLGHPKSNKHLYLSNSEEAATLSFWNEEITDENSTNLYIGIGGNRDYPSIEYWNNDKPLLMLGANPDAVGLTMNGFNDKSNLSVMNMGIMCFNQFGTDVLYVGQDEEGNGSIEIGDKDGKLIWEKSGTTVKPKFELK